jgi:hypothetical protein
MLSAHAIGQSLCSAKIADATIQPLLDAFPALPTFDPILGARIVDAILPIIRGVAGDEQLEARLLRLPHTARCVDVRAMVRAIRDLAGLTHFFNSPIAMLAQTHAPRIRRERAMPSTMPEAMEVFSIARELANLPQRSIGSSSGSSRIRCSRRLRAQLSNRLRPRCARSRRRCHGKAICTRCFRPQTPSTR